MRVSNPTLRTTETLNFRPLILNYDQLVALRTRLGTSRLAFYLTKHDVGIGGGAGATEKGITTLRLAVVNASNIIVEVDGKIGVSIDTVALKNTSIVFDTTTPAGGIPTSAILMQNADSIAFLASLISSIGTVYEKVALFFITPGSPGNYKIISKMIKITIGGGGPGSTNVKPAP